MTDDTRRKFAKIYRDGLLDDVVPFWIRHAVDKEFGGFCFSVGRDGGRLDTDKAVWLQARFSWLLATLYHEVEPREEWLHLARSGVEFLEKHGFDEDGRMFFLVTREGRPLRKRRYFFSEVFMIMAWAALARATGEAKYAEKALRLYQKIRQYSRDGSLPAKWDATTRPMRGLAVPMVLLSTAQVLRECVGASDANAWIDEAIDEISSCFVVPELEVVLETVSGDGKPMLDNFEGRVLNPGHSIEVAWFILAEAAHRGDPRLQKLGIQMFDWMWERGWDKEFGGLYYFRDVRNLPTHEYYHDMKFWWPHNEAILASLLAWKLTGDAKYADRHALVHEWTYSRFPDPEFGEWFGYLHRDGTLSSNLKGNWWKGGGFHVGRMQLLASNWLSDPTVRRTL